MNTTEGEAQMGTDYVELVKVFGGVRWSRKNDKGEEVGFGDAVFATERWAARAARIANPDVTDFRNMPEA